MADNKDFLRVIAEVHGINTVMEAMGKLASANNISETLAEVAVILQGQKYALGGGFAVSYHATPRATKDVDFMVLSSPECRKTLIDHGFTFVKTYDYQSGKVHIHKFTKQQVEVDLIELSNTKFATEMIARAKPTVLFGVTVPILAAEDLITLKALSNRDRDYVDIKAISDSVTVDWQIVKSGLADLRIMDRLAKIESWIKKD